MKRYIMGFTAALVLLTSMSSAAIAQVPGLDEDDAYLDKADGRLVPDPLEGLNRFIFGFNDVLITVALRPLSNAYVFVTPEVARTGISNVFHNVLFPVRFANNILQGRFRGAGVEMGRFLINTSVGMGGLFNVAKDKQTVVPVEDDEDLGQSFGVWGLGEGVYLVLPVLGPSTLRDTVGMVGDSFLDPITYLNPTEHAIALKVGRSFNELDGVLDKYDALHESAVEPYSAFRDAYVQYRRARIEK